MGRPKLPRKEVRSESVLFRATLGDRRLFDRVTEAMGKELGNGVKLTLSAAIRMLFEREARRLGVEE
jgi:hypothetical protein